MRARPALSARRSDVQYRAGLVDHGCDWLPAVGQPERRHVWLAAFVFERTRLLLAPILVHMIYNGIVLGAYSLM